MGEIIKVVADTQIRDMELAIELNKPHRPGQPNIVHLQTETFRWQTTERDFIQLAATTLNAISKLKASKEIGDG